MNTFNGFFKIVTPSWIDDYRTSVNHFFQRNEESYHFFHPHQFSYIGLLQEIIKRDKDYYVFFMDIDNIASYGMLRGWSEGYDIPSLGIMTDVNYRGEGISKLMMDHLHEIAKQKNCERIRLKVYKENIKAISLYNKLGYQFFDHENGKELVGIKIL